MAAVSALLTTGSQRYFIASRRCIDYIFGIGRPSSLRRGTFVPRERNGPPICPLQFRFSRVRQPECRLMARYSSTLRDQYRRPIAGGLVTVTASGIGSLATLTADDGSSLPNPFTTGASGAIVFNVDNGLYDLAYRYGGRVIREDFGVSVGNVVVGSSIADALGNDPNLAISQRATTSAITDANTAIGAVSAAVAGKYDASNPSGFVDAPGALAAAVGTDLTQAPSRAALLAQSAANLIGYRANPSAPITGSVLRTVGDKIAETKVLSPEDFGAVGDVLGNFPATNGVNPSPTDDTLALQTMFNQAAPGVRFQLSRVYAFSSTLVLPQVNYVTIEGDNEYTCGLLYIGASTTIDLIKIGAGATEINGWNLRRFIVDSSTRMTAGAAIHVRRAIFFTYDSIVIHGQYGNLMTSPSQTTSAQNLFNGLLQEGFLYCTMTLPDIFVRNTGLGLCGWDLGGGNFMSYGANFIVYGGKKIAGCGTGVLLGGGCYAVLLDEVDVIGNVTNNLRMTQELYPHGNSVLFCKQVTFDSQQTIAGSSAASVLIDDVGDSFAQPTLLWDGTWVASGPGDGLVLKNMGTNMFSQTHFNGCRFGNFGTKSAVKILTAIPVITFNNCEFFTSFTGIDAAAAGGASGTFRNVRAKNCTFLGVIPNKFSGNIEGLQCTWTPVFGTDSGGPLATQPTITAARYIDDGPLSAVDFSGGAVMPRMIDFNISFTMPSSVPSTTQQLTITLPWSAGPGATQAGCQGFGNTLGALMGIFPGDNILRVLVTPGLGGTVVKANEIVTVSGRYIATLNGH
jgi:hypothetical protein